MDRRRGGGGTKVMPLSVEAEASDGWSGIGW